mmetsp:Transcript_3714/g.8069  ORF Transcript_3714/g.8069 Transcript_3714/m.8069 type:complete len:207 (+) Transcript_3714:1186-1806(+)
MTKPTPTSAASSMHLARRVRGMRSACTRLTRLPRLRRAEDHGEQSLFKSVTGDMWHGALVAVTRALSSFLQRLCGERWAGSSIGCRSSPTSSLTTSTPASSIGFSGTILMIRQETLTLTRRSSQLTCASFSHRYRKRKSALPSKTSPSFDLCHKWRTHTSSCGHRPARLRRPSQPSEQSGGCALHGRRRSDSAVVVPRLDFEYNCR